MDPMLVEGFANSGFMTLRLAEGGFAYLMSNIPIRTTDELRNHNVWIPGNDLITGEVLKRVGVDPIPLHMADVLTSLQTRLADTVAAPPIAAIILPVALSYGIDPVQLGNVFLANMQIGYMTPPVGINLFIGGYRFEKNVSDIYSAALPFMIVLLIALR